MPKTFQSALAPVCEYNFDESLRLSLNPAIDSRIITGFFLFLFAFTSSAQAENHYSQVVARMDNKPGNLVVLTKTKDKASAERSIPIRSHEFKAIGWTPVNKGLGAGKEYDKKLGAMFADKPFSVSYLSFNDLEEQEVRINLSEMDTMNSASILNYYKVYYQKLGMTDFKIIHPEPRSYTSKEVGVTLTIPGSWFVNETQWGVNPVAQILIPRDGPQDTFTRNVSILKVPGKGTVEEYLAALGEFNQQKIADYEVTLQNQVKIKKQDYTYLESKGKVGGRAVKFLAWYTSHGGSIYNITYTEPEETPEGAKAVLQPILESLTWN